MGFLDPGKLLVLLVVALIVLGPERLPRYARQAGAAWRELTRVRDQVTEEIRSAMPDLDLPSIPKMPTNMVSGFIADLTRPSVDNSVSDDDGTRDPGPGELQGEGTAPDEFPATSAIARRSTAAGAAAEDFPLAVDDASMN